MTTTLLPLAIGLAVPLLGVLCLLGFAVHRGASGAWNLQPLGTTSVVLGAVGLLVAVFLGVLGALLQGLESTSQTPGPGWTWFFRGLGWGGLLSGAEIVLGSVVLERHRRELGRRPAPPRVVPTALPQPGDDPYRRP